MPELLEPTPHPEEQRSLSELRAEFRAANRERLHDQMLSHPIGWGVIGDPRYARSLYTPEQWAIVMFNHMDSPVTQDFGLDCVPMALWLRLEKQAIDTLHHTAVTWDDSIAGVCDHEAPPCPPVSTMTDEELCDYIDSAIKDSENG